MSVRSGANLSNTAKGLPFSDLTAAHRNLDLPWAPWPEATDEDINLGLDFLYTQDAQHSDQGPQYPDTYQEFVSAFQPNSVAMSLQSTENEANNLDVGENLQAKAGDLGVAHDMSTHAHNDFDHPQYQLPNTQDINQGDTNHTRLSASAEPKQEESIATTVTTPEQISSTLLSGQFALASHPMHRHNTDPTPAHMLYWPTERDAAIRNQSQLMNQSQFLSQNPRSAVPGHVRKPTSNRHRAAVPNPTSHPRQMQTTSPYAPIRPPGVSYHPPTAGHDAMGYVLQASPAQGNFVADRYNPMSALRYSNFDDLLSNNPGNQHINNRATPGMVRPSNTHHSPTITRHRSNMPSVPQHLVLKSHTQSSHGIDGDTHSGISQLQAASKKRHQQREMSEPLHETYQQDLDGLHYDSVEAAALAERPRFRANSKKDDSIPWTDFEKQQLVARMVRCMTEVKYAEDNDGMIKQWNKLKQDEARVEQAAWRILGMVLDIHVEGIPMLPNKPSCMRYGRFVERWDAICEGLSTQKTMCKHLLGSEFTAQLVNDPSTATQRVTNNRKVNAGKKEIYSTGRKGLKIKNQERGRGSSSASARVKEDDDEIDLHGLGEEDAEGETDEEYQAPQVTTKARAARAQMTPKQGSGSQSRRAPKRERDADDSGDDGPQSTKYLKMTVNQANRRAASRPNMTPKRQKESRSQWQALPQDGHMVMCDLKDKSYEDVVYNMGSAAAQAMFTKIHYPNGRPPQQPLRLPRAAAPTDLREDREDHLEGIKEGSSGSDFDDGEYQEQGNGYHY
ncbi:MAG: hypothetical protein Q9218_004806 [Villophora microphyllina]